MRSYGAILLREVEINCNFCPRRGKARVGRLMQEHGPDTQIPDLLRLSHDCPRRLAARMGEPCGVNLPELADVVREEAGR